MKTFNGYKKKNLTDSNLLLAGSGHKPLNELLTDLSRPTNTNKISITVGGNTLQLDLGARAWDSTAYLPLSGGTMTGDLTLAHNTHLQVGNLTGANNKTNYISAGSGYSKNSGKYGVKVLCCDQSDAQSGLGLDLTLKSGWTNAYNFCLVGANSSTDYGYISFVSHLVNDTNYRWLGGFYDNAGAINFTVLGTIQGESIKKTGGTSSLFLKADGSVDSNEYVKKTGDTMSAALVFSGVTGGNYNEGIRIQDASNKWAGITLGATGTTGCSPQSGEVAWFIAKQPGGVFAITADTSSSSMGLSLTKGEDAKWYNNVMLHAGNYTSYVYDKATSDGRYLRKDANDSTAYLYEFTKTNDHAIKIGTIRGRAYNNGTNQTGEYIHMYERVHIGSPNGWGSNNAPSYGLSTYGGAWLATDTGNVGIGNTSPSQKLHVSGNILIDNGTLHINGMSGSYTEGIRLHPSSAGWITIALCGTDNTGTSGVSSNSWNIHKNPSNNFYINRGSSDGHTGYELCNVSGNWGISTTSPSYKLHVDGSIYASSTIISAGQPGYTVSHSGWSYSRYYSGSNFWDIGTNQSAGGIGSYYGGFGIRQNGADGNGIYIKRDTSSYGKLVIAVPSSECSIGYRSGSSMMWTVGFTGSGSLFGWYYGEGGGWKMILDGSGNLTATNFYTTSDRNKKQNISSFSEHIRKFQLKDTKKWHYGVIALEVPEIFRDGEEGNMTVNYNSVLSYYIGLLENKVNELETKIKILENGKNFN